MSTHDSKNGLSNRGHPRLEVSPRFNGEESEFCPRFTPYTHKYGQNIKFYEANFAILMLCFDKLKT
jgi:hypothetical protein